MSNSILSLKGQFNYLPNSSGFVLKLPKKYKTSFNHLKKIKNDLIEIQKFWNNHKSINGALVSVRCVGILPKSNRISTLFSRESNKKKDLNEYICGICYNESGKKHIFTYFLTIKMLYKTILNLDDVLKCYNDLKIDDKINSPKWDELPSDQVLNKKINNYNISKTSFWQIIKDSCFIEEIFIKNYQFQGKISQNTSILKIYKTNINISEKIKKLGLIDNVEILDEDETTLKFNTSKDANTFIKDMPFLVAQQMSDTLNIKYNENFITETREQHFSIPDPKNEPVVGVIDTLFDKNVYFSKWVDYHDEMIDKNTLMTANLDDKRHGTSVTSIIVDGPTLNPNLNDNCGRFKVRHFAVALKSWASVTSIRKSIEKIIRENWKEIKVWNLSLGSDNEIHKNFISLIGALLDQIQAEYDVIFVVAGTNNNYPKNKNKKIGEPADSINSLVVNSVKKNNQPVSYTCCGPVLSFYCKPDVSYYGGDDDEKINAYTSFGKYKVCGTSFAAAWITRKIAFLIYKLNLPREVAKALIIDSAAKGNSKFSIKNYNIGYGVVPIDINEIIKTNDDEIKFVISSKCLGYETSTYSIPIPLNEKKKIPYVARATLCYFTSCSPNQGVDYANYEIDFYFGRIEKRNDKKKIKSIDQNNQSETESWTTEKQARNLWRKWDNVKLISSNPDTSQINWIKKIRPKKTTENGLCGLKLIVKNRLATHTDKKIKFGVVVWLKELSGENRINEFINKCKLENWNVNELNVKNELDITNEINQEIKFDN